MMMKQITSRDNARYKEFKLLATSAGARRKFGKTVFDGVHLAQSFLTQRGQPECAVVSESALQNSEVHALLESCQNVFVLSDVLFHPLRQVEHGVDLFFIAALPKAEFSGVLTENALILDGLQDPGNLGSILRSAAGAGITQVFCSEGTCTAWSPKVLRAGMGAHFALSIYENVDLLSLIQRSQIPVLATSSHTKQTIFQAHLNRPLAWLFGHEGQGVSAALMELASETVTIPQNPNIESLNVAAAAAICMFEQVRQQLHVTAT